MGAENTVQMPRKPLDVKLTLLKNGIHSKGDGEARNERQERCCGGRGGVDQNPQVKLMSIQIRKGLVVRANLKNNVIFHQSGRETSKSHWRGRARGLLPGRLDFARPSR